MCRPTVLCVTFFLGGFASGALAEDSNNYSRQLDGWVISKASNPDVVQLFFAEEKKNVAFGFFCPRVGAREYLFFDSTMKRTSQTSCQVRISQLYCDGQIIQTIKYCEENEGMSMSSVRKVPNKDAFFADKEPISVIETDRNVLTAITSAKRFCSINIGGTVIDLPIKSIALSIGAYIEICRSYGSW